MPNTSATAKDLKKPTVVLFSANWNSTSREAKDTIPAVLKKYNQIKYVDLDIDKPATPEKARNAKVSVPKSTPYVYLVSKNGKVLFETPYEDIEKGSFDAVLNKYIGNAK